MKPKKKIVLTEAKYRWLMRMFSNGAKYLAKAKIRNAEGLRLIVAATTLIDASIDAGIRNAPLDRFVKECGRIQAQRHRRAQPPWKTLRRDILAALPAGEAAAIRMADLAHRISARKTLVLDGVRALIASGAVRRTSAGALYKATAS